MTSPVAMPLWLLLPTLLFAMLGLWLVVIVPLLSNTMYRRRQRSLRKLDEQLEFGVSDYALAKRSDWLDRLLVDPQVVQAIESIAAESGEPVEDVSARARRDAEEIVPFFNVLLYFRLGYWIARWMLRMMYWIQAEFSDREALAGIEKDCCVVLVSNHRSNIDPFLLIYLASKRSAISYSAGEWARGWPIRYLLHAIGFYIVRRDGGGDNLHRTLLERYVYLAASNCVPQGLFLEGALSRDGEMQPLKLGLLNYLLKAHGQGNCKDIVFVPVGLSYDRIPEDKTLIEHAEEGFREKNRFYAMFSLLRFLVLIMPRMIGLTKPYGKVVANFGTPLSLSDWQQRTNQSLAISDPSLRRARVAKLGEDIAMQIQSLIPVLPVALLARGLLIAGEAGIPELQLKRDALSHAEKLRDSKVLVALEQNQEERSFSQALYPLMRRNLVALGGDGRLRANARGMALLQYYRNGIPLALRS
ncbi:MAG: 1-acyl-sn-glycerol-3-phosphate acyltransferase [Proteobacteria bacterium]|nr:1-acyl-sn-glycerol-3-phosphate acyltransferase [Pseudomonadota bacterium]